jgi:hypothetical protein
MPRTKTRFKADEIAVVARTFAWRDAVYQRGTRLRGDHAAVQAKPQYFAPDGTSDDELPQEVAFDEAGEWSIPGRPPLDPSRSAVAIRSFTVAGRAISKGWWLPLDDELVKRHPELFETAPQPVGESAA